MNPHHPEARPSRKKMSFTDSRRPPIAKTSGLLNLRTSGLVLLILLLTLNATAVLLRNRVQRKY